jgi:hypothetical protein
MGSPAGGRPRRRHRRGRGIVWPVGSCRDRRSGSCTPRLGDGGASERGERLDGMFVRDPLPEPSAADGGGGLHEQMLRTCPTVRGEQHRRGTSQHQCGHGGTEGQRRRGEDGQGQPGHRDRGRRATVLAAPDLSVRSELVARPGQGRHVPRRGADRARHRLRRPPRWRGAAPPAASGVLPRRRASHVAAVPRGARTACDVRALAARGAVVAFGTTR